MLSHIVYSSQAQIYASSNIKSDMQREQSHAFKIIGISDQEALERYSIEKVQEFIEHICVKSIKRMFSDQVHPLVALQRTN